MPIATQVNDFTFTHADPEARTLASLLEAAAADEPDRSWLEVGATRSLTFGECDGLANRLANGLRARGVGSGDRVAVLCPNSVESLIAWFGSAKIGAVYVPINIHYRGPLLSHVLKTSSPAVVIAAESLAGFVRAAMPATEATLVVVTDDPLGATQAAGPWIYFDELLAESSISPTIRVLPSDAQSIVFTSGTTGPSKGVVVSHNQAYAFADIVGQATSLTRRDTYYTCLPLFHINAQLSVLTGLIFRSKVAIFPRFSAATFWDDIRLTEASVVSLFGSMATILLKHETAASARQNTVRACWVFPSSRSIRESLERAFDVRVLTAYASTEANFVSVAALTGDCPPDSVGRVHPLFEVMISDSTDTALAAGTRGEILVRPLAPFITMLGYYAMPEATVSANANLWYHTGDVGYFDADGNLYFVDRLTDTIRRNGENISSMEVEAVVVDHPRVAECAVVGIDSELAEQDVMAFVVSRDDGGLSADELQAWCRDRMAYFMVPRFWKFVDELPKTPNGKVQKAVLKKQAVRTDPGEQASRRAAWRGGQD